MMLKNYHGILILFVSIGLCTLTTSCYQPHDSFSETYSFDIHAQSEIFSDTTSRQITQDSSLTVYNFSIQPGDSMVVEYMREVNPPDNVTDAGLVETLVFQIPPDTDFFELNDEELLQANTFYRQSCFCPLSGAGFKVDSGLIQGEMLSANIWFIEGSVHVDTYNRAVEVTFDGVFRIR